MLAMIFALGALMGPQELTDTVATSGEAVSVVTPDGLTAADGAGQGALMRSDQTLSAQANGITVSVAGGQAEIRTGDISLDADSVGSGVQALNLNTGFASISQASISVAAGALALGAAPK
jgi:hypothetical protein